MKFNFEKIFFYFMIMAVSGSIGYAIKPEPKIQESQISYEQQNEACVRAISMIKNMNSKEYFTRTKKTTKQIALERMQNARY